MRARRSEADIIKLKEEVSEGTYQIDPEQIADAILERRNLINSIMVDFRFHTTRDDPFRHPIASRPIIRTKGI